MSTCYLSGPMTGYPSENRDAFQRAASALRDKGWHVINPHELDEAVPEADYNGYLARDLSEIINNADAVVVLDGWEASKGVALEVYVARRLGKQVYRFDEEGLLEPISDASILEEAQFLVQGQRGWDYGHPKEDFGRTAKIWSAILDIPVDASQVALCMVGLKLSREVNRPKRDNRVDAAGYLLTLDMVRDEP